MKNPAVCPQQGLRTLPHAEHKQERHAESTQAFLLLLGVVSLYRVPLQLIHIRGAASRFCNVV